MESHHKESFSKSLSDLVMLKRNSNRCSSNNSKKRHQSVVLFLVTFKVGCINQGRSGMIT